LLSRSLRTIGLLPLLFATPTFIAGAWQPSMNAQCANDAVQASSADLMSLAVKKTPIMPPMMDRVSIAGTVTLRVRVNTKGRVSSATVIDGHPMPYQAALDSVQKWRFKPYRLKGRIASIEGDLRMEYDFRSSPKRGK
jgi:TonB family protein